MEHYSFAGAGADSAFVYKRVIAAGGYGEVHEVIARLNQS
jgi:hypothetical protein